MCRLRTRLGNDALADQVLAAAEAIARPAPGADVGAVVAVHARAIRDILGPVTAFLAVEHHIAIGFMIACLDPADEHDAWVLDNAVPHWLNDQSRALFRRITARVYPLWDRLRLELLTQQYAFSPYANRKGYLMALELGQKNDAIRSAIETHARAARQLKDTQNSVCYAEQDAAAALKTVERLRGESAELLGKIRKYEVIPNCGTKN